MFSRRLVAARAARARLPTSGQCRQVSAASATAPPGANPSGPASDSSFANTISRQPILTAAVGAATALAGYTVFCYTKEDHLGTEQLQLRRGDQLKRSANMRDDAANSRARTPMRNADRYTTDNSSDELLTPKSADSRSNNKAAEFTREDAKAASHNEFREGKAEAERARRAAQEKRQDAVDAANRESQDRQRVTGNAEEGAAVRNATGPESDGPIDKVAHKIADVKQAFGRTFGGGGAQTRYEEGFDGRADREPRDKDTQPRRASRDVDHAARDVKYNANGKGRDVKEYLDDKIQSVKDSASNLKEDAKAKLRGAKDAARDRLDDGDINTRSEHGFDDLENRAIRDKNIIADALRNAKDKVTGSGRDASEDAARDVKYNANGKGRDVKEYLDDKIQSVKDSASNLKEDAKAKLRGAKDAARDRLDDGDINTRSEHGFDDLENRAIRDKNIIADALRNAKDKVTGSGRDASEDAARDVKYNANGKGRDAKGDVNSQQRSFKEGTASERLRRDTDEAGDNVVDAEAELARRRLNGEDVPAQAERPNDAVNTTDANSDDSLFSRAARAIGFGRAVQGQAPDAEDAPQESQPPDDFRSWRRFMSAAPEAISGSELQARGEKKEPVAAAGAAYSRMSSHNTSAPPAKFDDDDDDEDDGPELDRPPEHRVKVPYGSKLFSPLPATLGQRTLQVVHGEEEEAEEGKVNETIEGGFLGFLAPYPPPKQHYYPGNRRPTENEHVKLTVDREEEGPAPAHIVLVDEAAEKHKQ
jgi:hypothetical protein